MKTTYRLFANLTLILFLAVGIISCDSKSKKQLKSETDAVAFEEAGKKISADINKVIKDLPNPTEVPYLLQATGADFDRELINSLDRISQYQSNEDKTALNLGIYATDMGYLVSYEQVQPSLDYMENCQKLAESLGIASVFDVRTMNDFQNNLNDPTKLNAIISDAIFEAEKRLESSDRLPVAALVISGSFVEGLYLAVKVIETYPTDILDEDIRNLILEPLVKVVLDQKKPLLDVIALLKDIPQDDIISTMIAELNILRILYEGDLAEVEKKISENTGDFILTQDMLLDITTEVKRIRTDIVTL
ncbi:MAG: hypothetical protein ACI9A7_000633 [Cyclobacteriaceae bacterium]|jgi:hypothetical protein